MATALPLALDDIRPGDRFMCYKSQRTGWFVVYHYRRVPGQAYDIETRLGIYPTLQEAVAVRDRLRRAEERIRAEWELQQREMAWAVHNMRVMCDKS